MNHGNRARERSLLLVLVLLALGVRLFALWYLRPQPPTREGIAAPSGVAENWAFGYEAGRIAQAVAQGRGYSSPLLTDSGPTAWLMPGYPLLLALVFKVFGTYTGRAFASIIVLQCFVSALTCLPLYSLGRRLFGGTVGYLATALFAVYPPSVWYAINHIWDTTVFTLLTVTALRYVVAGAKPVDARRGAGCGVLLGVCALFNAAILAFVPFLLAWLYFGRQVPRGARVRAVGALTLALAAVLSPWIVRNALVLHRPVLRSNFGVELRLGNNPQAWDFFASHGYLAEFAEMGHPSIDREEMARFQRLGELRYADVCLQEALMFVRAHPARFARLTAARVREFWLGSAADREWKGRLDVSFSLSWIKRTCLVLPIPLACAGIVLGLRKRRESCVLVGFLGLTPIVYLVTHVGERYKYPMDPVLLVFSSLALYSLVCWLKGRGGRAQGSWTRVIGAR
jgi:4-amino-4-deoxy-L-arabinose transferase-like glycosyltransferase